MRAVFHGRILVAFYEYFYTVFLRNAESLLLAKRNELRPLWYALIKLTGSLIVAWSALLEPFALRISANPGKRTWNLPLLPFFFLSLLYFLSPSLI